MLSHESTNFLPSIIQHLFTDVPSAWKRRRFFGPRQVLIAVMYLSVLGKRTYRQTLDYLFESMSDALQWVRSPDPAAFCRARSKLPTGVCLQAFRDIAALCPGIGRAQISYREFRIVAVDGTKLILPNSAALRRRFGCPTTTARAQVPQALLAVLWDVSRARPIEWRMRRWSGSERVCARHMAKKLGPGDLLIADRGFPSRRFFIQLQKQGAAFVIRVGTDRSTFSEVQAFLASGKDDDIVDLTLPRRPQRLTYGAGTFRVRLIKQTLKDGEVAVYATNLLDQAQHRSMHLIDLYGKRWRLENVFRDLKLAHDLELLRSRSVLGVQQEITAMMIYMLLASEFESMARARAAATNAEEGKPPTGKPPTPHDVVRDGVHDCGVRLNHRLLVSAVASLFVTAITQPEKLSKSLKDRLDYLWRCRSAIRPNRSYPRRAKSPNSRWRGGRANGWG